MADDFTEAYDLDIDRVDLVGKAANGRKFLMLKASDRGGLIDDATMADLLKADQSPEVLTVTGSPAAIAAMIHTAAVRKADDTTATINDLPDSDFAYIEQGGSKDDDGKTTPRSLRHFPIQDAAHVRNALARAPQSPYGDEAMPKIRAAAKRFGIDVAKETPMDTTLAKDVDLDASTVTAEPADDTPGEATDPGSAAWEAIDAATAAKWVAILGRAKNALGWMADREATEAVNGDPDDGDAVFNLEDAACAIDYAIGVLATFAAGEQLEADTAADELEAVGKAVLEADGPLSVLEGLAPVRKAGRVLSAQNETAIRDAVDALQKVLASLPAAPQDDTTQSAPEEAPMTKTTSTDDTVSKAKGDPVTVVFDENGKPLGVIDPKDLVPITKPTSDAPAADDDTDATDDTAPDDDTPAAPEAPALVQPDANDGPAANPQTPAEPADLQKALDEIALLKSTITDAVEAAVAPLRERLENVEKQPMPGGPMLNGIIPGAAPVVTRGDVDNTPEAMRKAFDEETDPIRKQQLQFELAAVMVQNARRL